MIHLRTPGLTACPAHSGLSPSPCGAGRRHSSLYPAPYFNLHQIFLLSSALKPKLRQCWKSQHFPQDVSFPLVHKALHRRLPLCKRQEMQTKQRGRGGLSVQPVSTQAQRSFHRTTPPPLLLDPPLNQLCDLGHNT